MKKKIMEIPFFVIEIYFPSGTVISNRAPIPGSPVFPMVLTVMISRGGHNMINGLWFINDCGGQSPASSRKILAISRRPVSSST